MFHIVRRFNSVVAFSLMASAVLSTQPVLAKQKDIVDTAVEAGSFNTLAAALKAAGLIEALKGKGPFTVFAPTDEAFAKLPKGTIAKLLLPENKATLAAILKYHVVAGKVNAKKVVKLSSAKTLNGQQVEIAVDQGKVQIDGATVVKADIKAKNGIIHVIDRVIMPSTSDIVATAVEAGSFKTLAAALKAASLVETLQGKGPFTVFAPTDKAFSNLPAGTVAELLKPENLSKLQAVLTYHVVPGRIFSTDLANGSKAKTVQGGTLSIELSKKNGVRINGATVVKADIDASNGVIHVIDSVLLPSSGKKTTRNVSHEGRQLIELALSRGVPLYNSGNASGCAAVYEIATEGVMALCADEFPSKIRARMTNTVASAKHMSDGRRAWMLRHVLDYAHAALAN